VHYIVKVDCKANLLCEEVAVAKGGRVGCRVTKLSLATQLRDIWGGVMTVDNP
jgi:hypothetical protein